MRFLPTFVVAATSMLVSQVWASEVRIVSWNVAAQPMERVLARASDYRAMSDALAPDVLVLIELTGVDDLKAIAKAVGWPTYYAAVSDGQLQGSEIHFSLEVGILSRVPITSVVELDSKPEGRTHPVFTSMEPDGDASIPVKEVQLKGIDKMGLAASDRGTLRVDLSNGLTVFPVHLKSNSNDVCFAANDTIDNLKKLNLPPVPALQEILDNGSEVKAKADRDNAFKRERVIAATKAVADMAINEGRTVLIAGDWNTSFEAGKFGQSFDVCVLAPFSCEKAPFLAEKCSGDGYDDTFAIMTGPLVGNQKWKMTTERLGRTYTDTKYADKAIDHIAIPEAKSAEFSMPEVGSDPFGSDHYPVSITWTGAP